MNTRLLTLGLAVVLAGAIFIALRGASVASDPSVPAEADPTPATTPATAHLAITVDDSSTTQREEVPTDPPIATTVAELDRSAQLTHVVGRVVDITGAVPASRHRGGRLTEADGSESEITFALDGDGRFRLDLAPGDRPRTIAIRVEDLSPPRGAKAAVPVLAAGATFDVGVMMLVELPLLLRGHVVDDLSRPISDAQLVLMETRDVPEVESDLADEVIRGGSGGELAAIATLDTLRRDRSRLARRGGRGPATSRELGRRMSQAPDGSFEFWGDAASGAMTLRAEHVDLVPLTQEAIVPGSTVTVRMVRGANLSGQVMLPDWLPRNAVRVSLVGEDGGQQASVWGDVDGHLVESFRRGDAGPVAYTVVGSPPGRYAVEVRVVGFDVPCHAIRDVVLAPGDRLEGPRFVIDLRHALHRYRFRAVDATGALLAALPSPLLVDEAKPDGTREIRGFAWRTGEIEVFSVASSLDVRFFAPGYALAERSVVPGDHTCVFVALQPVEVVLPGLRRQLGDEPKLRVSMVRTESTGLPSGLGTTDPRDGESHSFQRWHLGYSGGAWLETDDVVRVPLVFRGTYDVVLRLQVPGVPGETSIPAGRFECVLDGLAPSRIVPVVDPVLVRNTLEALRARRG